MLLRTNYVLQFNCIAHDIKIVGKELRLRRDHNFKRYEI